MPNLGADEGFAIALALHDFPTRIAVLKAAEIGVAHAMCAELHQSASVHFCDHCRSQRISVGQRHEVDGIAGTQFGAGALDLLGLSDGKK